MAKRIHIHFNVRGLLRGNAGPLEKIFQDQDGNALSADDAHEYLCDELKKGHEVIPWGDCDNFDYSGRGCLGHEVN